VDFDVKRPPGSTSCRAVTGVRTLADGGSLSSSLMVQGQAGALVEAPKPGDGREQTSQARVAGEGRRAQAKAARAQTEAEQAQADLAEAKVKVAKEHRTRPSLGPCRRMMRPVGKQT
jgi:hypothetical protein